MTTFDEKIKIISELYKTCDITTKFKIADYFLQNSIHSLEEEVVTSKDYPQKEKILQFTVSCLEEWVARSKSNKTF